MQRDSLEVDCEHLSVDIECGNALDVRGEGIRQISFRVAAQIGDIELNVMVQDALQLLREFGAVGETLALRQAAKVHVSPSLCVVFRLDRFEERLDGTFRALAVQRVLGWGWVLGRSGARQDLGGSAGAKQ